jgi:hypothetical protein
VAVGVDVGADKDRQVIEGAIVTNNGISIRFPTRLRYLDCRLPGFRTLPGMAVCVALIRLHSD